MFDGGVGNGLMEVTFGSVYAFLSARRLVHYLIGPYRQVRTPIQYSTVQYSTVQYSTVQHTAALGPIDRYAVQYYMCGTRPSDRGMRLCLCFSCSVTPCGSDTYCTVLYCTVISTTHYALVVLLPPCVLPLRPCRRWR